MTDLLVNVVGPVGHARPVQLPADRPLAELTERLGLVVGVSPVTGISGRDGTVLDDSLPLAGRVANGTTLRVEGKLRRDALPSVLPGSVRSRPNRRRSVAVLAGVCLGAAIAGAGVGYGLAGKSSASTTRPDSTVAATALATTTARAWMAGHSVSAGRIGPPLAGTPELLSTTAGTGEVTDRFLIVSGSGAFVLTVTVDDISRHHLRLVGPATASTLAFGDTGVPQQGQDGHVAQTPAAVLAWAKSTFTASNPATVGQVLAGTPQVTAAWEPKTPTGTVVLQVEVPLRTGSTPNRTAVKAAGAKVAKATTTVADETRAASTAHGRAGQLEATSVALSRFVSLAKHPTGRQRRAERAARRAALTAAQKAVKANKTLAAARTALRADQDTLRALQAASGSRAAALTGTYDVLIGGRGVQAWSPAGLPLGEGGN